MVMTTLFQCLTHSRSTHHPLLPSPPFHFCDMVRRDGKVVFAMVLMDKFTGPLGGAAVEVALLSLLHSEGVEGVEVHSEGGEGDTVNYDEGHTGDTGDNRGSGGGMTGDDNDSGSSSSSFPHSTACSPPVPSTPPFTPGPRRRSARARSARKQFVPGQDGDFHTGVPRGLLTSVQADGDANGDARGVTGGDAGDDKAGGRDRTFGEWADAATVTATATAASEWKVPFAWLMALRIAMSQTCRSFMELAVLPVLEDLRGRGTGPQYQYALEGLAALFTSACMLFVWRQLSPSATATGRARGARGGGAVRKEMKRL